MKTVEQLWEAFNFSSKRILLLRGKDGQYLEDEYARAYQLLVKRGVCMQLRERYRA